MEVKLTLRVSESSQMLKDALNKWDTSRLTISRKLRPVPSKKVHLLWEQLTLYSDNIKSQATQS
jgi:hypothetical protein